MKSPLSIGNDGSALRQGIGNLPFPPRGTLKTSRRMPPLTIILLTL